MRRWITGIPCFAGGHLIQHCATPPLRLAETARCPPGLTLRIVRSAFGLGFSVEQVCDVRIPRRQTSTRTKPSALADRRHSEAFWQEALRQIYAKIMLHRRTPSYLCSESWNYGAPNTNRTCDLPLRSRLGALFKINSLQQRGLFHQLLTMTLGNSGLLTLTLCLRQIYAQNFYGGLGAERKIFRVLIRAASGPDCPLAMNVF